MIRPSTLNLFKTRTNSLRFSPFRIYTSFIFFNFIIIVIFCFFFPISLFFLLSFSFVFYLIFISGYFVCVCFVISFVCSHLVNKWDTVAMLVQYSPVTKLLQYACVWKCVCERLRNAEADLMKMDERIATKVGACFVLSFLFSLSLSLSHHSWNEKIKLLFKQQKWHPNERISTLSVFLFILFECLFFFMVSRFDVFDGGIIRFGVLLQTLWLLFYFLLMNEWNY